LSEPTSSIRGELVPAPRFHLILFELPTTDILLHASSHMVLSLPLTASLPTVPCTLTLHSLPLTTRFSPFRESRFESSAPFKTTSLPEEVLIAPVVVELVVVTTFPPGLDVIVVVEEEPRLTPSSRTSVSTL